MSAGEGIVFALFGRGERFQSLVFTVGVEVLASSGEYLVGIRLMPHVPYQPVVGRVVHVVQGYGQLYHAECRPEMSGIVG